MKSPWKSPWKCPWKSFIAMLALLIMAFAARAAEIPMEPEIRTFIEAYNKGDAAAVSQFYADKAAVLPPRAKAVVGREAIAAHYDAAFKQGVSGLKYKVLEIEELGPGNWLEIGETQVMLGKQMIHGRYMHVWKQADGQWLLHRDMYHVLGVQAQ